MEVIRFQNELKVPWILLTFAVTILFSCQDAKPKPLRIATAANQIYVIDSLISVFEKTHATKCDAILGPSARLMTQIDQGAPYDIFLSADKTYTDRLYDKGRSDGLPRAFAIGELVVLTRHKEPDLATILQANKGKVAIPNPEIAPYGAVCKKTLTEMGLWGQIQDRVVFGESVSQTNQFFLSGSAHTAITSSSIQYGPEKVKRLLQNSQVISIGARVTHYGMVVNHRDTHEKAQDFFSFILSREGQAILKNHGYLLPE